MKGNHTEVNSNEYVLECKLRYLLMKEHARRDVARYRERRPGNLQFDGNLI